MGHLVVMDDSEAQFAPDPFTRAGYGTNFAPDLPPSIEYQQCGTLLGCRRQKQEMAAVRRKAAFTLSAACRWRYWKAMQLPLPSPSPARSGRRAASGQDA